MRIRIRSGEEHPQAKFTNDEAEAIRKRFEVDPKPTIREVAEEEGCGRMTIQRIARGITYR